MRPGCIGAIAFTVWWALAGSLPSASLGPRELFELGGIGREQLDRLADREGWQESNNDVLRQMLYRIEKDVRPGDFEDWVIGNADLERFAEEPKAYRMQVFRLRGRVLLAERYRLSERAGEGERFASIWRCRMKLDFHDRPVVEVFTARLPKAWAVGEPIDEPSGALAFFLKTGPPEGEGPAAYFVTDRVAWYPPTYLGRLGMDVGLLDDVVVEPPPGRGDEEASTEIKWKTRLLTEADHECFYQMLDAVGRAEEGQLSRWAREELAEAGKSSFSVVPLFNRPETQQGRLVELKGTARRILPVRVGEEKVKERFGIEEYYQVYLFTEDSQNNPLVFCLRELPEGLPAGDGPGFGETLSVPGFFFKTWSYPVATMEEDGEPQRQLAPLLIGKSARWYPATAPAGLSPMQRAIGTGVLVLVLGIVWWVFRQYRRGDREFTRRVRRRIPPEVSEMDWNALDRSDEDST